MVKPWYRTQPIPPPIAWTIVLCLLAGCRGRVPGPAGPAGPPGAPGCQEYFFQPAPGESLGGDATLSPLRPAQGQLPDLTVGADARGDVERALLYFDLSQASVPAGASLLAAILVLTPNPAFCGAGAVAVHAYPVTEPWKENEATWTYADGKHRWAHPGGDYAETQALGGFWAENLRGHGEPVEIFLNPTAVQTWLRGRSNYGIVLKADYETGGATLVSCYSREYANDPGKRPALKLYYLEKPEAKTGR